MSSASTPELTPEYLAEDSSYGSRVGIVVVTTLSFIVVGLRCYTRCFVPPTGFRLDDVLICITAVFNAAVMALFLKSMDYGVGKHFLAIPPASFVTMFQLVVAVQLVYHIGIWVCRLSGLALYSRICGNAQGFKRWMLSAYVFVTLIAIAQTLILSLQCIPLKAVWGDGPGKCMGSYTAFISTAAMTIACDTLILIIPIRIIWPLQMPITKKIALGSLLLLGLFTVMTSVFRILSMIPAATSRDPTWLFPPIQVWSSTELSTAIIALSIPALKPLMTRLGMWRRENSQNSNSYNSNTGEGWNLNTMLNSNNSMKVNGGRRGGFRNISEENLCSGEGITKTVAVDVQNGERDGDSTSSGHVQMSSP